ncbi:ABC transporter ATP-binding protein [Actinoplanes sp. L3-i22]|uniref:ABC transporter ATP-binding protein n=1 Tax=Actinoplanes sp. L3-i22 TaxID=2836373 RepID=UPI001C78EE4B|nr:ATP-binding cassette domain-containing protein [Actinoplanes sp. L3-i22]BCY08673.1 sugar ABC transporter [Actinoplanes sp. L3-i22]
MTSLLHLDGLGKRYGAVSALHDVSLSIAPGTVHCVLGENGAGKSTLCNLINGSVRPSGGTMRLHGRAYAPGSPAAALGRGVAMVHQHFSLVPTLTVRENLLLATTGGTGLRGRTATLTGRLARIADEYGLRVRLDQRVAELPVGDRQRVEIVKALLPDPDLVLLDEPTGVLDGAGIDALIGVCRAMAASGRSVVLVTHKLGEVSRAADVATVLRAGTVAGGGRLADVPVPRLLALMLGHDAGELEATVAGADTGRVRRATGTAAPGPAVLRAERLRLTRRDGTRALDGVDLQVRAGEIVGIAGVEGNGQSELVRVLSGALRADSGTVHVGADELTTATPAARTSAGLGVVPEDRHQEGMVGAMSVAENLFLGRLGGFRRRGLLDRKAMDAAAAEVIAAYAVRTPGPRAGLGSLSGGNQQKVVLARELSIDGLRVLIAAQPTRGLDVGAVGQVLTRLREAADRGVAILVVSSEVEQLLALCDRILVSYRGRLLGPIPAGSSAAPAEIGALMTGTAA